MDARRGRRDDRLGVSRSASSTSEYSRPGYRGSDGCYDESMHSTAYDSYAEMTAYDSYAEMQEDRTILASAPEKLLRFPRHPTLLRPAMWG